MVFVISNLTVNVSHYYYYYNKYYRISKKILEAVKLFWRKDILY